MLFDSYSLSMQRPDASVLILFSVLRRSAALLLPVSFVVLMASLFHRASPRNRIWARLALSSTVVHVLIIAANYFLYSYVARVSPDLYRSATTSLPVLRRYGAVDALGFTFVSLALLLTWPIFHRGGIEMAIRCCFVLISVLTVASGLGYVLTTDRVPALSVLSLVAHYLIFPLTMAFVAAALKRNGSAKPLKNAETS
jgi:hypothetical protein